MDMPLAAESPAIEPEPQAVPKLTDAEAGVHATHEEVAGPSTPRAPPSERMDDEMTRRRLAPIAWAGHASASQLRMLASACRNLGDNDCRNKARALLKATREERGK